LRALRLAKEAAEAKAVAEIKPAEKKPAAKKKAVARKAAAPEGLEADK
jgi:hypothetical protein